jgi:hypothetical protein
MQNTLKDIYVFGEKIESLIEVIKQLLAELYKKKKTG